MPPLKKSRTRSASDCSRHCVDAADCSLPSWSPSACGPRPKVARSIDVEGSRPELRIHREGKVSRHTLHVLRVQFTFEREVVSGADLCATSFQIQFDRAGRLNLLCRRIRMQSGHAWRHRTQRPAVERRRMGGNKLLYLGPVFFDFRRDHGILRFPIAGHQLDVFKRQAGIVVPGTYERHAPTIERIVGHGRSRSIEPCLRLLQQVSGIKFREAENSRFTLDGGELHPFFFQSLIVFTNMRCGRTECAPVIVVQFGLCIDLRIPD